MSKTSHPYLKANFFQRIFYSWVTTLLQLAHKRPLEIDDIFDILPDDESQPWIDRLEKAWQNEVNIANKSNMKKRQPSLLRALWKTYRIRYCVIGILLFINSACRFIQPFILARYIKYFASCSNISLIEAIIFASITSIFPWIMFYASHLAYVRGHFAVLHLRCAQSGLLFRKITKLSMEALGKHSTGKIINLLTNDIQAIDTMILYGHFLWIGLLETFIVLIILWSRVGITILLAFIYTCFAVIVQIICGKCTELIWTKRVKKTDSRIKLMNEIIKSIHIVKMYVWERSFQLKVERIRRNEMYSIMYQGLVNTIVYVNSHAFCSTFFLITFGLLWYRRAPFDMEFFTIAFVLIYYLSCTYSHSFPTAIIGLSQYLVASKRIEEFLLSDEYRQSNAIVYNQCHNFDVDVQQVSSTWEINSLFQLHDISFSARVGDLIMIIGSIGSGKSSLLMTLLGEMKILKGKISLKENSHLCYVPQEPWIFSGTIRQNILFGLDYNPEKFNQCIELTALDTDLKKFPYGDSTLVGDNGIILSGGQKARLALARALYRDDDIYLLDDPLSSVDIKVARHIFEKCILEKLHSKVYILVTHQIQFLNYATKIIFLDKGVSIATGTYTELIQTSPKFIQWIKTTVRQTREDSGSTYISPIETSLDHVSEYLTQITSLVDSNENDEQDKLLSSITEKPIQQEIVESKATGSVGVNVFLRYIQAGGCGILGLLFLFLLYAFTSALILFANWWLGKWSDSESIRYSLTNTTNNCSSNHSSKIRIMSNNEWFQERDKLFYVFLGSSLLGVILLFIRTIVYFISCHLIAQSLHNQMFNALLRAPVFFFDSNPIGRIVNRFSSDISSIDEGLPDVTHYFIYNLFSITTTIIFLGYMQPLSLIPMVIVGFLMERIRRIYTSSAQDMKRLQSLVQSPIYSYLSSSIQGVLLIRSYRVQQECIQKFTQFLDKRSQINSVMFGMNRWFAVRIETMVAIFIDLLIFSILIIHRKLLLSDLSLIMSYSFTLMISMQWFIESIVDTMVQMTSVERVIEYSDLKPEEPANIHNFVSLPLQWPNGRIVFENLSFRYSSTAPWVLKNINISIQRNEKIGIVGRTGAGKSSIIQALFRMAEFDGRILIDGIDIKQISLYDLRRHISIIPQNPLLFNDTLRVNLDPFGEYSDFEIWNVLDEVQLKSDMIDSLQQQVTEGGSNFSVGQRQLICLARALLRKNQILVIDEATANVDHKTSELIQLAIRRKFAKCTILTIAHRLRTIIDSDKILFLSDGQVMEFADPYELLNDKQSQFSQLVSQTGDREMTYLIEQARIVSMERLT